MFFAGGGSGDAERCVMREYGRVAAMLYAGIRRRTGDALCGNMKESGQCGMREYGRAAAVRR